MHLGMYDTSYYGVGTVPGTRVPGTVPVPGTVWNIDKVLYQGTGTLPGTGTLVLYGTHIEPGAVRYPVPWCTAPGIYLGILAVQ